MHDKKSFVTYSPEGAFHLNATITGTTHSATGYIPH